MEVSWELILAIWATVLFASILRTFVGFGMALAAVPVFSFYMTPVDSVILSAELVLAISIFRLNDFWYAAPLKPMFPILLAAAFTTLVGTYILTIVSTDVFRMGAGLCVVIACVILGFYKPEPRSPNTTMASLTGGVSGLMNGLLAMSGPPVVIYTLVTESDVRLSRIKLMKLLFIATIFGLLSYLAAGLISSKVLIYFLIALPALYIGDRLGNLLFERFGERLYRKAAITLLLIVGFSSTVSGLTPYLFG